MAGDGITMQQMNSRMAQAMREPDADKAFLKGMIAHHQGAIGMCQEVIKKGSSMPVKRMARKIMGEQSEQVNKMRRLLKDV